MKFENYLFLVILRIGLRIVLFQEINCDIDCLFGCDNIDNNFVYRSSYQVIGMDKFFFEGYYLEEKWYVCLEEVVGKGSKFLFNIYSFGVLLFEVSKF